MMTTLSYYQMTDADLEEQAELTKTVILRSLVSSGMLKEEEAEEWSALHTLIKRKKGFFRTISSKWQNKEVEKDTFYWLVVKRV